MVFAIVLPGMILCFVGWVLAILEETTSTATLRVIQDDEGTYWVVEEAPPQKPTKVIHYGTSGIFTSAAIPAIEEKSK